MIVVVFSTKHLFQILEIYTDRMFNNLPEENTQIMQIF